MFGETEITSFSLTGLTPFAMFWMHPPPVGMNVLRSTAQRLYAAACLVSLTLFGSCRRKRAWTLLAKLGTARPFKSYCMT